MTDLVGKVALITGGSKGIGRAIALAYGKLGITVALMYLSDKDSAHDAVLEIESGGGKALAIHADVRNEASIKAMIAVAFWSITLVLRCQSLGSKSPRTTGTPSLRQTRRLRIG